MTKLFGFAALLALVFGVATVAGGAVGPDRSDDAAAREDTPAGHGADTRDEDGGGHGDDAAAGGHAADAVRGLAVADDGLRLSLADTAASARARDDAALHDRRRRRPRARLRGRAREADAPDRRPPRRLRLPAPASDDGAGRHLEHADHAARRGRVSRLRRLQARRERDAGGRPDRRRRCRLPRAARADRRRYHRRVCRELDEHDGKLSFAITRDGKPVETEPYLGAGGHLVALREGDLAYLHVHPVDGHGVEFETELDPDSRYRLYLQFKHEGQVHTAEFTR